MATFSYKIVNPKGKEKKGTIEAPSVDKAAKILKGDGSVLVSITEAGVLSKDIDIPFTEKKVTPRDMSVLCQQFVSIISAGVGVVEALRMLTEQTENKKLRGALRDTQKLVEKGETLAGSMSQCPEIFPVVFVSMIRAGEESGTLETSFKQMAVQFQKEAKLKGMMKKAMIYPAAVMIVAVVIIIVMMAFVIPNFVTMFEGMDAEMPAPTLAVMAMSDFVVNRWYVLVIGAGLIALGFRIFAGTTSGKYTLADLGRKAPLLGELTVKSASANLARTLSTLLASGVSVMDALAITAGTMTNLRFKDALLEAKEEVSRGVALSEPLQRCELFPPMVYHMIGIGEETGNLDAMLTNVADYYEEEVELATQSLMAALEPLIIVLLALIVGGIIGAVMMPMLTLYDSVGSM